MYKNNDYFVVKINNDGTDPYNSSDDSDFEPGNQPESEEYDSVASHDSFIDQSTREECVVNGNIEGEFSIF